MKNELSTLAIALTFVFGSSTAHAQAADTVLWNAKIYTMNETQP